MKRVAMLVLLMAAVTAMPATALDHFTNYHPPTGAANGAKAGAALNASNSLEATIGYRLESKPAATVTISIPGVPYVSDYRLVSKGAGSVKVRFSVLCSPKVTGVIDVNKVKVTMLKGPNQPIATSDVVVQYKFKCPLLTGPLPMEPDLVITSFGMTAWGTCAPGQAVYTFGVTVKNQGLGTWSGAEPRVVIRDMHSGVLWGAGAAINPPLAVGESRSLSVPVLYYASGNFAHMWNAQPHPFRATVNEDHVVSESNYANNAAPGPATWGGMQVIMMGAPQGCAIPTPEPPR